MSLDFDLISTLAGSGAGATVTIIGLRLLDRHFQLSSRKIDDAGDIRHTQQKEIVRLNTALESVADAHRQEVEALRDQIDEVHREYNELFKQHALLSAEIRVLRSQLDAHD